MRAERPKWCGFEGGGVEELGNLFLGRSIPGQVGIADLVRAITGVDDTAGGIGDGERQAAAPECGGVDLPSAQDVALDARQLIAWQLVPSREDEAVTNITRRGKALDRGAIRICSVVPWHPTRPLSVCKRVMSREAQPRAISALKDELQRIVGTDSTDSPASQWSGAQVHREVRSRVLRVGADRLQVVVLAAGAGCAHRERSVREPT